jgi:hypothetical protein
MLKYAQIYLNISLLNKHEAYWMDKMDGRLYTWTTLATTTTEKYNFFIKQDIFNKLIKTSCFHIWLFKMNKRCIDYLVGDLVTRPKDRLQR